jgi:hypothetical protein
LKISLTHYATCELVTDIHVVWSDTQNAPPLHLLASIPVGQGKIQFETHEKDSLSNRFIAKLDVKTQAVLSVDDDVIIPCEDVSFALGVWQVNNR